MAPPKFSKETADSLLVKSQRSCCICHKFCGNNIEIHHIDQTGGNEEENAIPLCFDCHAEVGQYDSNHPKGRKFTSNELRKHKQQWFRMVKEGATRSKLLPNEPKEADFYIDELPAGGGYFNLVTSIGEKYINWRYAGEPSSLVRERVVIGFLGFVSLIPLYLYLSNDISRISLTDDITTIATLAFLGIIMLASIFTINNTQCKECGNFFGLKIEDSKLIEETEKEYSDRFETKRKFRVVYKCKKCGKITRKTVVNKIVETKTDIE